MKGIFGIEEPILYLHTPTSDGRWMVGHGEGGKYVKLPMLYDSEEEAKQIAELLSAREMQRYKDELATVKSVPGD